MTCVALIVAAGRGARSGEAVPKQYVHFMGRPILYHTVQCFLRHRMVDDVVVVIHPDDQNLYDQSLDGIHAPVTVPGGRTRQESVLAGLDYLDGSLHPDQVLIHDAARPFVSEKIISDVIARLDAASAVIPVVVVTDTIKRVTNGDVDDTLDRTNLYGVQTPQGFDFQIILAAHRSRKDQASATDDAAIVEAAGISVQTVPGDPANIKITNPEDFALLRMREVASAETRTGIGFDVHRLGDGTSVTLCGVDIDHTGSLIGHSDADVALHALTDALLGSIGAGDIGRHFPPSDPQWKGVNSQVFVEHAVALLQNRQASITNVDMTIICEAPKITPHAPAMCAKLAEILGVDISRISVKATTTEQLGVTGQGGGIAAQSLVTIRLPILIEEPS